MAVEMTVGAKALVAELDLMQDCHCYEGVYFTKAGAELTCPGCQGSGEHPPTLEDVLDVLEEEGYEDISFIRWNGWHVNTPKGDVTIPGEAEGCRERIEAALLLLKEVRHGR